MFQQITPVYKLHFKFQFLIITFRVKKRKVMTVESFFFFLNKSNNNF